MKEFALEEDRGHVISFSQYGNPDGATVLSFHGGPGSGSKPSHVERFDLSKYRVILFDQRGCGKSAPAGEIENNTTDDILLDAERIREKLGIQEWFVAGASWGSTCALLYAIKYPEKVQGLLLSAVFLADKDTIAWSMEDPKGAARFVPDVWARRMEFFKKFNFKLETQNADILRALAEATPEQQKEIAAGVKNWESNLSAPHDVISYKNPSEITEADIASVRVFAHYEQNHEFLPDNYIVENIERIAHIPTVIVHGRYDINCPLEKAYALSEKMNNCKLIVATSCGHHFTAEGETLRKEVFDAFMESRA